MAGGRHALLSGPLAQWRRTPLASSTLIRQHPPWHRRTYGATGDGFTAIPHARRVLAWIYVAVSDHPHAVGQLDSLLAMPYYISPAWLRIDPTWTPLKGDPNSSGLSHSHR